MNHKEHGCYFSETASVFIHKFHQRALEVGLFHKQFGRWNSGEKRERESSLESRMFHRRRFHGVNETLGTFGYIVSNFGGKERRCS